jgi:hypothetical protein
MFDIYTNFGVLFVMPRLALSGRCVKLWARRLHHSGGRAARKGLLIGGLFETKYGVHVNGRDCQLL